MLSLALYYGPYITYAPVGGKTVPTQLAKAPSKSIVTAPVIIPFLTSSLVLESIITTCYLLNNSLSWLEDNLTLAFECASS
jgi:hypothetical protein